MIRTSVLLALLICPAVAQELGTSPAEKEALVRSILHDKGGMVMAAQGFVRALESGDGEAFVKLTHSFDELPEEAFADDFGDADMPPRAELQRLYQEELNRQALEFENFAMEVRTSWPVLPAKGITYKSVQSIRMLAELLPEDPYSWNLDQAGLDQRVKGLHADSDDVLIVSMEATYPGCEPVLFEFDLQVVKVPTRWAIVGFDDGMRCVSDRATEQFVAKAAKALIQGELGQLQPLLADEKNVQWLRGHRSSKGNLDDWTTADAVPDGAAWVERYHLAREALEQQAMDRATAIVSTDVEVLRSSTDGATETLSVNAVADYGDAGQLKFWFQMDVMRVPGGYRIPAHGALQCGLYPAKKKSADPLYKAAQKAGKIMSRPGRKDRSAEIIEQSDAFLSGCELLGKRSRTRGLLALANAQVTANGEGSVLGLIQAATLYDRAHKAHFEVGEASAWPQIRSVQDAERAGPNMYRIISECLEAADPTAEPAFVADCYEAAALAGSWYYPGGPSDIWTSMAETARRAAVHFLGAGEADRAFNLFRRYFPVEGEEGMPSASKLATLTGLPPLVLQDGYQGMGVLLYNQAVAMWPELRDSTRARPALRIRIRQRTNMAKQAFRVANQAAEGGSPYDNFIASCDQLLGALAQD